MMGLNSSDEAVGDYGTPEQEVPPQGLGDKAIWESCMTMNGTWGFHKYDHNWKSASQLIQILVDCASKGGNYLLNVGPTGLGEIPPESVERLAAVGKWMNANSEAVYGTKASPLPRPLTWGRITQKPGKMYFHWFPGQSNQLLVPGLNLHATRAYELADSSRSVRFASNDSGFTLMPIEANTSEVKVFVVEYSGTPVVKQVVPKQSKDGSYTFLARDAESTGSIKYEADKNCLGYWLQVDSSASWKFECTIAGTYELVIPVACPEGSAGGECQFDIAGQKENFKIPLTGAWSTFVPLKSKPFKLKTGLNTLTFRGIKKPGEALLNLGDVKLVKR
jgi:alpha-L-fucosidase